MKGIEVGCKAIGKEESIDRKKGKEKRRESEGAEKGGRRG